MRVAVAGKGGAGKSVLAGTLARVIARRGERVLALDSDTLPGLSLSLGSGPEPAEPPLIAAGERRDDGWWHLKTGIGPVRAIQRYSTAAPDGIRLLQSGKVTAQGIGPVIGASWAFNEIVHRLDRPLSLSDWSFVGDLPAGPRQIGFDWAPYAQTYLVATEPTAKAALTARRIARIARMRGPVEILFVATKVTGSQDTTAVERLLGEPVAWSVPFDPHVAEAERLGRAPIDHAPESATVASVEGLVDRLAR